MKDLEASHKRIALRNTLSPWHKNMWLVQRWRSVVPHKSIWFKASEPQQKFFIYFGQSIYVNFKPMTTWNGALKISKVTASFNYIIYICIYTYDCDWLAYFCWILVCIFYYFKNLIRNSLQISVLKCGKFIKTHIQFLDLSNFDVA